MPSTPSLTIPTAAVRSTAFPDDAMGCLYRMTVDEYEQLAEANVLLDRRVELIDGYLVRKMTTKPPHVWAVDAAREKLDRLVPIGWDLREEKPVRIPAFDEPEPDVSIVSGTRDDYVDHHPGPGEIGLLVEVSESSLTWDKGPKLAAYARAEVPVYWIINLVERQIEVYSDPRPEGFYRDCRVFRPGDEVPVVIAGSGVGTIPVTDLLPPGKPNAAAS
jgi:Uma2 family endonuclease